MFSIGPSKRLRPTPFHDSIVKEGVSAFTVYNNMLLATSFGDPEVEYWRLIHGVSQWDVACERQVEIKGPDAGKLAQILATRDLSKCQLGQGKYVAICNHQGVLINDPICLKLDENHFWFSIADSNIWFWAQAIASERGLNVEIGEPDVSPMAVQGPKAEDVVASIFGDWVRDLKYFWFQESEIEGIPVAVQRSGWSKQGGFEIYLRDGTKGTALWDIVKEAGAPYDIGPGNPNWCERIESGLLSYGGDTDERTNPFEVRMEKYVDLDLADDVVGIKALRDLYDMGIERHQLGIIIDGDEFGADIDEEEKLEAEFFWHGIFVEGQKIGDMTNSVWSRRLEKNIGFALVSRNYQAGDQVELNRHGKRLRARLSELPFI